MVPSSSSTSPHRSIEWKSGEKVWDSGLSPTEKLNEARITVNGIRLSESQSLYVRAAVENALHELTNAAYFASVGEIATSYQDGLMEVRRFMAISTALGGASGA